MTQMEKIIRPKLGLLELAKQLGNVSQACKIIGSRAQQLSTRQGSREAHRRRAKWSGQNPPSFERRRWRAPRNGRSMVSNLPSHPK